MSEEIKQKDYPGQLVFKGFRKKEIKMIDDVDRVLKVKGPMCCLNSAWNHSGNKPGFYCRVSGNHCDFDNCNDFQEISENNVFEASPFTRDDDL